MKKTLNSGWYTTDKGELYYNSITQKFVDNPANIVKSYGPDEVKVIGRKHPDIRNCKNLKK